MDDDNQDQPGLPVPTDAGEINNELEGLQEEMGDTKGPYWSGPASQRKQARYRQLVEAQERHEGGADGQEEAPAVVVDDQAVGVALDNLRALGTIGGEFANEIGRTGAKPALEMIEETRLDILQGMGNTAGEVAASFDVLSENVRAATYAELARAYVPRLPAADAGDLGEFATTGAGKLLVPEWGADAARRLAIVLFRWERLTEPLSDAEFHEIDDFWRNRLQPRERAAVLRRLTA